ncbi:MAG: hypothetical protein IKB34_06575 [Clostridia bacterium]|nr:hypothetical protein [Clostridia bacterium]
MKNKFGDVKNAFYYFKDFCEDTAENIRETAVTVMDSAKLQYRIISQRNYLNSMYASLGRNLYNQANGNDGGELEPAEMNALCERISSKEEILKGLEKQLRIVSGKVICSSCGRFMSERYRYCPYCGKEVSDAPPEIDYTLCADITSDELDEVRQLDDI